MLPPAATCGHHARVNRRLQVSDMVVPVARIIADHSHSLATRWKRDRPRFALKLKARWPPSLESTSQQSTTADCRSTHLDAEETTSWESYGTRSSAIGRAAVTYMSESTTTLSYRLEASARANGGHYRTGIYIAGRIGFTGHDSDASVDAIA